MKKVKEELKEKPTISKQRKKWEKILDKRKGKEKRTKAKQDDREKERQEQQRETTERLNLAEIQRQRIQARLKRKADEELARQELTNKQARIEAIDVPEQLRIEAHKKLEEEMGKETMKVVCQKRGMRRGSV